MSKREKPDMPDLTPKQRRFAEEYCIDLNATAAYLRAGYTARGNSAEAAASRLLSMLRCKALFSKSKGKLQAGARLRQKR